MGETRPKRKNTNAAGAKTPGVFGSEMGLWVGILTAIVFLTFGGQLLGNMANTALFSSLFFCLFIVMLWLSFSVVRHADRAIRGLHRHPPRLPSRPCI